MRADTLSRVAEHHVKPLVIRGGLASTFGSLVGFLAVIFLSLGLYLLGDASNIRWTPRLQEYSPPHSASPCPLFCFFFC